MGFHGVSPVLPSYAAARRSWGLPDCSASRCSASRSRHSRFCRRSSYRPGYLRQDAGSPGSSSAFSGAAMNACWPGPTPQAVDEPRSWHPRDHGGSCRSANRRRRSCSPARACRRSSANRACVARNCGSNAACNIVHQRRLSCTVMRRSRRVSSCSAGASSAFLEAGSNFAERCGRVAFWPKDARMRRSLCCPQATL